MRCRRTCTWVETTVPIIDKETGERTGTEVRTEVQCTEYCWFEAYITTSWDANVGTFVGRSKGFKDCKSLRNSCQTVSSKMSEECFNEAVKSCGGDPSYLHTMGKGLLKAVEGCVAATPLVVAGGFIGKEVASIVTKAPEPSRIWTPSSGTPGPYITVRSLGRTALSGCLAGIGVSGLMYAKDSMSTECLEKNLDVCKEKAEKYKILCEMAYNDCEKRAAKNK